MPMRGSGAPQFNPEDAVCDHPTASRWRAPGTAMKAFERTRALILNDAIALLSTGVGRNIYVRDIDSNGTANTGIVIQKTCRFLLANRFSRAKIALPAYLAFRKLARSLTLSIVVCTVYEDLMPVGVHLRAIKRREKCSQPSGKIPTDRSSES
jgi:hypothetical protein